MLSPPSEIGADQAMKTDLEVAPATKAVESDRGELGVVKPMCRPWVT
jgi:hypothetical protein